MAAARFHTTVADAPLAFLPALEKGCRNCQRVRIGVEDPTEILQNIANPMSSLPASSSVLHRLFRTASLRKSLQRAPGQHPDHGHGQWPFLGILRAHCLKMLSKKAAVPLCKHHLCPTLLLHVHLRVVLSSPLIAVQDLSMQGHALCRVDVCRCYLYVNMPMLSQSFKHQEKPTES